MAGKFQLHVAGDLIMVTAMVIAVIIGGHILFVFLEANPANAIVRTDADWAGRLAAWFKDMFTPENLKLRVFINYGLAVLFYLGVGGVLRTLVNGLQK